MKNEDELKQSLTAYVKSEMDQIQLENEEDNGHVFSSHYNKKIDKVLRHRINFWKKIYVTRAMRRVAAAALVIMSLLSVTQISARIFGFRPWNYTASFDAENIMDQKEYLAPNKDKSIDYESMPKISRDIPDYVPDGFVKKEEKMNTYNLYAEWEKSDGAVITYSRYNIISNMFVSIDSECESKEKISVSGYEGNYYVRGGHAWINWDDTTYGHMIFADNLENAKSELMRIAENLYQ